MKIANLIQLLCWPLLVAASTASGQPAHSPEAQRVLSLEHLPAAGLPAPRR
jgi:hypothetical protein